MKKLQLIGRIVLPLLFLLCSYPLFAQTLPDVKIAKIPVSVDEFVTMRNKIATNPQGGAAMFIVALKIYTQNKELGEQCLTVMTDKKSLRESTKGYKGYSLLYGDLDLIQKQFAKQQYIPDSYIDGATPNNSYKAKTPYLFKFSRNRYSGEESDGTIKIYVACSGASTPRPITLKINDKGIWKASEWSSLLVGIRTPTQYDVDDL